ncbi:HU family DNA-binding protein [Brevibacillus gelatini]|uniref:HU family DNA-binding protein n=1 Tax=Brevibacillus gelatini TaxID=1655277 RepID=A0A3M8B884_9BACL|nr:HU family DNA-binding protein [Brevibacillus gelatini]RNB59523.1 HU family DNA-binding protein [Brevibacillus gelatini]
MNKTELVSVVAQKAEMTKKDSAVIVDAVLDAIAEGLKEHGKVSLLGFGNFVVRERAARKGRNPQTGEEIDIVATKVPAWKPSKTLKDSLK